MKKLLSALVALAMLGSMTTMAFAEDADVVDEASDAVVEDVADDADAADEAEAVVDEAEDAEDADEDVIVGEENGAGLEDLDSALDSIDMEQVEKWAEEVRNGIQSILADANIKESLEDVVNSIKGMQIEDLFSLDSSKAAGMMESLANALAKCGIDLDDLYAKLKDNELVKKLANLYVPEKKPVVTEPTTVVAESTTEAASETPAAPQTGSTSAIAAFAVMSVAAAAAFVSFKKKAE